MSKKLIQYIFVTVWFVHLNCEIYEDRPKIKTSGGDLILEPAFDKNIYLLPNGPKSKVFVGEDNILKINSPRDGAQYQPTPGDRLDKYLNGPNGILQRLDRLENKPVVPNDLFLNISTLWREVNTLNRKVLNLQTQTSARGRDECKSNPCEHGGTCLNLVDGYHCMCPSSWEGPDCDIDVNECRNFAGTDLGCQNGGTCLNRPGSYECLCRSGWFGLHCTRKAKDCSGGDFEMCGHGTCIPITTGEGIKCICHQGWTTKGTGVACLTDVNECESDQGARCSVNPRVDCINLPGSFRCGRCPSGYEGDGFSCSDIDECVTIPNGGCSPMVACHNTIGSRICGSCPPGYQGDGVTCSWRGSCSINRGGCHPSAQCIDDLSFSVSAQCMCPDGMDGDGVGLHGCYVSSGANFTKRCEGNPCGANGQCLTLREGYTCSCHRGFSGAHCEIRTNICNINPCLNGGFCRPDDTSTRGVRCECTALYSGPLCQELKTCGGVLDAVEGSIVYPVSETTYNHNVTCAWVIHTRPEKVINVTFSKFSLEKSSDCQYDFLQIHDGRSSASQLVGRFCGNNIPKGNNIISSHNNMYLWFRSDGSVAKDGFALHWTSVTPVCGGEVNAITHGHISSPGSPGQYSPNRDCYWHLTTDLGKRIQLHFFALDIESHKNCSYDYFVIYDGEHASDPLLGKYCNSTQPAPVLSDGSELMIHFHSDAYGSGNGFQIAYFAVEGVPGCGGYFTTDKGEVFSPSFNGSYLNNLKCEYKIKTRPDTKIRVIFKTFRLENSLRCKYDFLKIYDGPSQNSPLIGKFCGRTFPKTYTSSSNTLFFIFKSDHSTSYEGFRITYEAICQYYIVGDSGIIKSPGYPFNYPANRVCEYVISTTPGKVIELTFQNFDIEDSRHYECRYDYVEIKDGPNTNSSVLGKYCGGPEHIPPVKTSTHNYMYIKFNSDVTLSGTGFYANYTTVNTGCGGIYTKNTGLINHPSEDGSISNDQECYWILIAPEGMHIKLTWTRFDIEKLTSCNDYLELLEIDENNEISNLGKYCGTRAPPDLTTSTNRLKIRFKSDSSTYSAGFSVSYTFLDDISHCGGTFLGSHGYIYSPGWPYRYGRNRECIWRITVPVGQLILLNISQFDLERPIQNKCELGDYLEIRNGASQNSPLIRQYCGRFQSKLITSMSNSLYLHFHSDISVSGGGFKIEWDGTINGCGGTLTGSTGSISSPNYPNEYNENAECFYRIVTNPGSGIRISFIQFDLMTTYCIGDYVEVYDGRDTSAASLGKACSMSPKLRNIETSTNYAFIKFRSDFHIGGIGFLLNYNIICHKNLTARYGVIESPDYPNNYPSHIDCLWTINAPKGNKINITFSHFDIYKFHRQILGVNSLGSLTSNCERDYMQWKESSDTVFSEKICGNTPPPMITSKSSSVQIKFVTNNTISHTGFRLEWVSYGCGGHIQKQTGFISLGKSLASVEEMECEWLIETSVGSVVYLTLTDLHMTESQNCSSDAIEIYNGKDIRSPLISKICHQATLAVQSSANFMFVRFIKSSTLKDVYFSSWFYSIHLRCGGSLQALSGFIYSTNYPKNYENNMDCIWLISVPINHRIALNFLDLDLYSDYNDQEDCGDSLKIYDSEYMMNSNYTYRICPNSNITQITTKHSTIMLQFITDSAGTAKGFKANFSVTCGAVITAATDGIISNENYFSHSSRSCLWTIIADKPDQKISLTITHMSLPKDNYMITNRSCSSSFIRVFDGNDNSAPLVDEFCGRKVPAMIVSHGSAITLELGTYSNTIMGEFSAHYSPMSTACGGTLTSEEGVIASPNYPRPYSSGSDCEWTLKPSPGNRAYVTFERFDLKYSEGCNEDYLELRENYGGGRLLGVYCGNDIPTDSPTSSQFYIKFHSDDKNNGQGFLLHYGLLHGNDIIGLDNGEIASPFYPHLFVGAGEYEWRITINGSGRIIIAIKSLKIKSNSDICYNKLFVYDGYNDEAPILEEFCGILTEEIKVLQTSSNVAYIKLKTDESNSGASFYLTWTRNDTIPKFTDSGEKINCGSNHTELIFPGHQSIIQSPNYPQEYEDDLNCEWVFKCTIGNHLRLDFSDFKLEETNGCNADSLSIYSSATPGQWQPVKENLCLSDSVRQEINSSNYMKITFKTDSMIRKKGFQARVSSRCGGLIADLSGEVGPTWNDYLSGGYADIIRTRCDWTIKVKPGRVIKIQFIHFNITNTDDICKTFLILRNGDSNEAPMLASGKYCGYSHENRGEITTSSNSLFISYELISGNTYGIETFQNFKIHYEEKNIECGVTSKLDVDHRWEILSTPNYPLVPLPYSECVWTFSGPPGEILRIDFVDRFDLENVDECATEAIEIRDGISELSALKGRFCGERPGTIKTSSNTMFIKYVTQLADPRNGFKANVSIDVCGGTIVADTGELMSPGYPNLQVLPYGTVCEWHVKGTPDRILQFTPSDVNLPGSESSCATKITFEEPIADNDSVAILKTFCNEEKTSLTPIETLTNQVTIKLYIGKPSEWNQISEFRGFRFTFNTSRARCGGFITAAEGYLTTPSYPMETPLRYCPWIIEVPNKTRRIRLEILDFNAEKQGIDMYNDFMFRSAIQIVHGNPITTRIYESSGNKLMVSVSLNSLATRHRFKAKFTSNDQALCGGELTGLSGELLSPYLERSYFCEWYYKDDLQYNTIYVAAKVNSSVTRRHCRYTDSILIISSGTRIEDIGRQICGNTEVSFRLPTSVPNFKALKIQNSSFSFHLKWKFQPCGGTVQVGGDPVNILNISNSYNDTLDCAWLVVPTINDRIELKIEGLFQLNCDSEFVIIGNSISENSAGVGTFCKGKRLENPITANYALHVEYHSNFKNVTDIKLMARTVARRNKCGGYLDSNEQYFSSPNFPKSYDPNLECSWMIKSDLGSRISLQFTNRFAVEDRPNCTKDAVIIYDWKDKKYNQVARLCGRNLPAAYNSTNNQMKVVLRTDADINLDGFNAEWSPICGGNYLATETEQFLYSPGFPLEYKPHLTCSYEISAPKNKKLYLKFLEFELEGDKPDCQFDNLTVTGYEYYFYGIYCGSEIPLLPHSYSKVSITFNTDDDIQKRGFQLSYKIFSCGGRVTNATELSINLLDNYEANTNCTWLIAAPENKIVVLKFAYIDLESSFECYKDYIAVYNGLTIDSSKRLALICGHDNSTRVLKSTGNKLLLQFVTDSSLNYDGFKAYVMFSYSESIGCGGQIDLTTITTKAFKSPLIGSSVVYENFLDCHWTINSPEDTIIKIEFKSFHISPCRDVNQTAFGYSKCDCDLVEIIDGVNPNSLAIGRYCGHTLPPLLFSSKNFMTVRLTTDGEISSSGFEASVTVQPTVCGQSHFTVSDKVQRLKSPGYDTGFIPRGLHCMYHFDANSQADLSRLVHLSIITLDLEPPVEEGEATVCNKDKLFIASSSVAPNITTGKDFVVNYETDAFLFNAYTYINQNPVPNQIELCGNKTSVDLYVIGRVTLNLLTSAETSKGHKGLEIEVVYTGFCGRNYTESQGRIQATYESHATGDDNCYTLITAPENYTISAYFLAVLPLNINEDCFLDIFDGNDTSSPRLIRLSNSNYYKHQPTFSTNRYMLLHGHQSSGSRITFDINYITTNRGRGCGGKLVNEVGRVSSPMYPETYRQVSTCEWELETPVGTRLYLHFTIFDMGRICDQNYLQLVDSKGNVISTYCSETPADYTSKDNFVKIVFVTTMNNSGSGWFVEFVGIK